MRVETICRGTHVFVMVTQRLMLVCGIRFRHAINPFLVAYSGRFPPAIERAASENITCPPLDSDSRDINRELARLDPHRMPVFPTLEAVTREASLRPVRTGVVLFNLPAKRIVQIDNTYEPLAPSGELHYHNGRFLSRKVVAYRLPATWSIVP